MRTSNVTAVLERTLQAKADQAGDAHTDAGGGAGASASLPAFDPTRRPTAAEHGDRPRVGDADGGRHDDLLDLGDLDDLVDLCDLADAPASAWTTVERRSVGTVGRRTRALVAAAACLVLVALVATPVVLGGDQPDDLVVQPLELGDPPDGWLLPGWVPEGMDLWGIDTSVSPSAGDGDPATIPQLFGDPQGDRAVYVTSHRYEIAPATAEDVAVRGTTGSAGTGWGAAEEDLGAAVRWRERGADITALYRGVSRDEAIAVLDALEWRSDDPVDGFAPPDDDAWPLRAEATSRATVSHDATLVYSDGVPSTDGRTGPPGLTVSTTSSSAVSAGYLETWYLQGEGDGTGPLVSYRADWHELAVHWPDGRSVTVGAWPTGDAGDPSVTHGVLERIATSAAVATPADLADVRQAVGDRIAALPVVATADTAIGAVDIHAEDGYVRLCLRRPDGGAADCDTSVHGGAASPDGSALATAQWTIDGSWTVAVASRGEVPRIMDATDPTVPPGSAGDLPAETVTTGDWTVQVVRAPSTVDTLCLGSDAAMTCLPRRSG